MWKLKRKPDANNKIGATNTILVNQSSIAYNLLNFFAESFIKNGVNISEFPKVKFLSKYNSNHYY